MFYNSWFRLEDHQSKAGVVIVPVKGSDDDIDSSSWSWSASQYSQKSLECSLHDFELPHSCDGNTSIHVDKYSSGVGGYDSWSPTYIQPKYMVFIHKDMSVKISLRPFQV